MRNDRHFSAMPDVRYPTPEEVRWHLQQSARMRSEAVHDSLHRAAAWIGGGTLDEREPAGRTGDSLRPRTA